MVLYKLEKARLKELIALPVRNEGDMLWGNTIGEDYYIVNRGNLQKYDRGSFRTILEVTGFGTVYSVFGRHEKDMFMVTDAGIVHYNGTDIQLLYETGAFPSAMLFEKEVFFFKNDFSARSNVIYHGVLDSITAE